MSALLRPVLLRILLPILAAAAIATWSLAGLSSSELVHIRNSFLAEAGQVADFSWTPATIPEDFLQEGAAAPAAFTAAIAALPAPSAAGNFARAKQIASHLVEGADARGEPLMQTTARTYADIRASGGGYCSDYTQVFNGLAHAAGIPVREWGMSFGDFAAGHAFNEVWDADLGKWVFLDPFYSFWVSDAASGEPLSALEFRERLLAADAAGQLQVTPLNPAQFAFTSEQKALDYYRRGIDQIYLWWGNNVFSYDEALAVRALGPVSRALEQGGAIVTGVHPGFRILSSERNAAAVAELGKTRKRVLLTLAILAVLGPWLLWQAWRLLRRRRT